MNKNGSSYSWLIPVGVVVAILALVGRLPNLLLVGGITLGVLLILVVGILIISLKGSSDEAKTKTAETKMEPEDAEVMAQARKELTGLRVLNARIREADVRSMSNEICNTTEKILSALKENPARISSAQMFLQYYLPTQKNILTKYHQIAESGMEHSELKEKVMAHLTDIKTATEKQLMNVYEDDMMDISAEMEMMNISIKEDGLV